MNRVRPARSIRVRMALWYSATMALVLLVYAGLTWAYLGHRLLTELDERLASDLGFVRGDLDRPERREAVPDPAEEDEADRWVEVRSPEGVLLRQSFPPGQDFLGRRPELFAPDGRGYRSVKIPGGPPLRVLQDLHQLADGSRVLVRVARSERQLRHDRRLFLLAHGIGLPLAVLLAGLGGYSVSRRALAPVDRMTRLARSITAERLSDRLPVDNPDDELGHLAEVFNQTFSRLEASFDRLRRFTADASHELRTPLTALRSVGEVGLAPGRSVEDLRETVGSMLEEADRMARLVDGLLSIARAEGGAAGLDLREADLSALTAEVAECLEVLAEEKGQTLSVRAPGPVPAVVDRMVLRQALLNILDNAIRYTPEGGRVDVRTSRCAEGAEVVVEDSGPGIAPEHRERVFERLYRVDRGRAREHGGCGLGLSIAKWAVGAHGGRIELASEPGRGSRFRVVLPDPPPPRT